MGNFFSIIITKMARKVLFSHSRYYDEQALLTPLLPSDLMLEILHRLPSKPLMRFLSVSKAWHSVILSPSFAEKHQTYRQHKFISFLHPCYNIGKGVRLISKKIDDDGETNMDVHVPLPFALGVPPSFFNKVNLLGCSNGLVCIRFCETTIFYRERTCFGLWNPATRQFKLLPSPKIVMYRPPDDDHQLLGSIDGFSYIPRIRDYKLVRILVFKDKRMSANVRYWGRALVLNVAKKSWRELENHELPCSHQQIVVTNGCLHLLVFRPEGVHVSYPHASLLSFDLDEERFRNTSVPYLCNHLNCGLNKCWRMLTVFNEKLAVFVSPKFRADEYNGEPNNNEGGVEELGNYFELWVLDELTWCWSKKFRFGPLPRRSFPIGFWSNGKIVIRKNYYNQPWGTPASVDAYLYNPYDKETSVIPCHERKRCSLAFYSYVESLGFPLKF